MRKIARLGLYLDKPSLETPSALFQMSAAGDASYAVTKLATKGRIEDIIL
jgi:hypothetical protein